MKISIAIKTNNPKMVQNAFRLGNIALKENHPTKAFLTNKEVETEHIKDEKSNAAAIHSSNKNKDELSL